jgi:hypothetical protein
MPEQMAGPSLCNTVMLQLAGSYVFACLGATEQVFSIFSDACQRHHACSGKGTQPAPSWA